MSYHESDHDYDREGRADAWGDALDERYLIDRAEHEAHAGDGDDRRDWTDLDWIIDEDGFVEEPATGHLAHNPATERFETGGDEIEFADERER
jgi:hypothetical protein